MVTYRLHLRMGQIDIYVADLHNEALMTSIHADDEPHVQICQVRAWVKQARSMGLKRSN